MMERHTIYEKSGIFLDSPGSQTTDIPFLKYQFPFQFFVIIPLIKRLLPKELFLIFFAWKKEVLWNRLIHGVGKNLGEKIAFHPAHFAYTVPMHYAYTVTLEDKRSPVKGYGQSVVSGDEALSKALGEFLERYSLNRNMVQHKTICATQRKLSRSAVNLGTFPLYLSWQKRGVDDRFVTQESSTADKVGWIKVSSLLYGNKRYVPAQRVLWGDDGYGQIVNQGTTSGSGAGFTEADAICAATYELIERDSFMYLWLQKLTPRRIDPTTIPIDFVQNSIKRLRGFGMDIFFLDVTSPLGVPVVATVITRDVENGKVKVAMAAAAGYQLSRVFLSSLLEVVGVSSAFIQGYDKDTPNTIPEDGFFTDKSFNRTRRLTFWRQDVPVEYIQWFLSGNTISYHDFSARNEGGNLDNSKDQLRFLKDKFRSWIEKYGEGYHPYLYTPPFVKTKLSKYNYTIASVIVPSFYPLYLNEHMATLDLSNLPHWHESSESEKVHGSKPPPYLTPNTYPHPFP